MSNNRPSLIALAGAAALAGCASTPYGPTVAVLPAPTKPFEVFRLDDSECQAYAGAQVSGEVDATRNRAFGAAVLTTALATAAGAAIGAAGPRSSSSAGEGAAIGAGIGALAGAGIGSSADQEGQSLIQRRYDIAYSQCMYARGNQVPGYQSLDANAGPPPGFEPPRPRAR